MIEFSLKKQALLTPLLALSGVVDKRQSLPVLSNLFCQLDNDTLTLTATDLEIEMTARIDCCNHTLDKITIPARKVVDIVRSLDDDADIRFTFKDQSVSLQSGKSRFRLLTLPAQDFPKLELAANMVEFRIKTTELHRLLQMTSFAMSQQDVRIYLNGLLLEFNPGVLSAVCTDGHRMAIYKLELANLNKSHRIIVPRKGIQEILRLLTSIDDEDVLLHASEGHLGIDTANFSFITKLVESRYPAYNRVIPRQLTTFVLADRDNLKRALTRIMILANEKTKAIVLSLQKGGICLIANNQQQEEAIEEVEAEVDGELFKVGINAGYLLDVISQIPEGLLRLSLSNADSSILLETLADEQFQYVIMPMKL